MSRLSNLFAAGIFIVFLAILFHYFCRVRKKPDMIVQQQIQVPEGYVYPISSNINHVHTHQQLVLAPNFRQLHTPFVTTSYPLSNGMSSSGSRPEHLNSYNVQSNHSIPVPGYFPPNPGVQNQIEDLPPPYHVAVASTSHEK